MRPAVINPEHTPAVQSTENVAALTLAWQLRSQTRWSEAERVCCSLLSRDPSCGEAWHLLGLLAHDQGISGQAVSQLNKAIAVEPHQPLHYNSLGVVLHSIGHYEKAAFNFQKALDLAPGHLDAKNNLGLTCFHQNQFAKASRYLEEILAIDPHHSAALANLGMTQLAMQKYADAVLTYEQLLRIGPGEPAWHGNLGSAFMRQGKFADAAACYRRAFQMAGDKPEYLVGQAIALRAEGRLPESIEVLEAALAMDQKLSSAIAHMVVALEYTCHWDKLDLYHPMLRHATQKALANGQVPDEDPMQNIRYCDDLSQNQAVNRAKSRDIARLSQRSGIRFSHKNRVRRQDRITVGYLSYDFRNHPVAHQLFPLFSLHDRKRFHTVAFSMGPDDGSIFRREIMNGCDEFVDIASYGLDQAAHAVYDRQVDILVDLMGHSHHNRMEILALRPAPVQVGYLGFLSTSGADFIDYLIADGVVVPNDHNPYYDEKIVRMPHCYQLNPEPGPEYQPHPGRESWGLPAEGFVFCSFNSAYKIDRELFDTWLRILQHVPGSVLWLSDSHPMATRHMRSRAGNMGIDPNRLVFAAKRPLKEHIHRLPLADLALDTFRYNGGATTANALAAGLPVVTVKGRHWVSRMCASHLIAAGLPDLVFETSAAYEQAAIELSRSPQKLFSLRQRLKRNKQTHPLFDVRGFVRDLERGYEAVWQRYLSNRQPDHIDISPMRF